MGCSPKRSIIVHLYDMNQSWPWILILLRWRWSTTEVSKGGPTLQRLLPLELTGWTRTLCTKDFYAWGAVHMFFSPCVIFFLSFSTKNFLSAGWGGQALSIWALCWRLWGGDQGGSPFHNVFSASKRRLKISIFASVFSWSFNYQAFWSF